MPISSCASLQDFSFQGIDSFYIVIEFVRIQLFIVFFNCPFNVPGICSNSPFSFLKLVICALYFFLLSLSAEAYLFY